MNERLQRAMAVWIVAFILLLFGLPLFEVVGSTILREPFWILAAVVVASLLALLEALT